MTSELTPPASPVPETGRVAALLKRHRRRAGFTQEELAEAAGISVRSLRDVERGRTHPRPSTLRKIASSLSLSDDEKSALFLEQLDPAANGLQESLGPARGVVPMDGVYLPPETTEFVGREQELAGISKELQDFRPGERNVIALVGMPGIGKTALALRWARANADRFPDGTYFIDAFLAWFTDGHARGFPSDNGAAPYSRAVIEVISRTLNLDLPVCADWPSGALLTAMREELQQKRMLVILNNVPSAAHVRSLLPGLSSTTLLLTSRRTMDSLVATHGARQIVVPPLTDDQSAELVDKVSEGAVSNPDLTRRVLDACDGHPFALRIAAVTMRQYPELMASSDIGRLIMRDVLDDRYFSLRGLFQQVYGGLPQPAVGLLLALARQGREEFTVADIAESVGIPTASAAHQLSILCSHSLIHRSRRGVYTWHRVVRHFMSTVAVPDASGDPYG
ncbi:transcriptional regulator, XRE family [Actinobacteria bacterium OK074]|nr:transcriptional regulator, XRE family [Actinobacteria bacterium OK074]